MDIKFNLKPVKEKTRQSKLDESVIDEDVSTIDCDVDSDKIRQLQSLYARLWTSADELRANSKLRSNQYSPPVLGLLFLRYAYHKFDEAKKKLEKKYEGRTRPIRKIDYQREGVIFLPENARYEWLLRQPESENIGGLLDDAMRSIETENDESKILFFSLLRLIANSYSDLLPDPRANKYRRMVSVYVHIGETIAAEIPDVDISDIERRIEDLIDRSIGVKPTKSWDPTKFIDLRKIDLGQIRTSYKKGRKRTEAQKLKGIINRKLAELLRKNKYRIDFQERLEKLVDDYNNGSLNIEQYFEQLTQMINDLEQEERRYIREGLKNEEELTVFDILTKPVPKLTKNEETQVKRIAQEVLQTIKEQKLVLDWKKKTRTRADVQLTIEDILWEQLPETPYPNKLKEEKIESVYQHIYDSYQGVGLSIYTV